MVGHVRASAPSVGTPSNDHRDDVNHLFDNTRLCKFFAKGKCARGAACTFAHGEDEVRPQPDFFRTQLCVDFVRSGACQFTADCRYAHSFEELRRARKHRKIVAPPLALDSQSHQLEVMENMVRELRSHLEALRAVTSPSTSSPTSFANSTDALAHQLSERIPGLPTKRTCTLEGDLDGASANFSRQSTEEGDCAATCFTRQTSIDVEFLQELTLEVRQSKPSVGTSQIQLRDDIVKMPSEDEVKCELVEKNTFLCLQLLDRAPLRRTRSFPDTRYMSDAH